MKMKQLIFGMSFCVLFVSSLFAQLDTLCVPAETAGGDYYINSLIDYIVADTNAAGEQLHRVYKLERSKLYLLDQAVDLRNPVQIVADDPVENDPDRMPPKILSNTTANGETATGNLFNVWADITIKNVWLGGMSINGSTRGWGMGQAIAVQDSCVAVHLDRVWLDYNGWSVFGTSQPHTKWYINNLHARNEQNPGDQWTTFVFYFENAVVLDTIIVKNSTYFQSNSFFLFPPAYVKYMEIDHCTFVNTLKWPFHSTQWLEAKITNSIFYNMSSLSLTESEEEGQDSDNLECGIINVDTLIANEVGSPGPYTIPEKDRTFIVKNNCYYWSAEVQDYWANHSTVKAAVWMNSRTQAMFNADAAYPDFIAENNWNQDPQFNDFSEDLAVCNQLLAQVCIDSRAGSFHQWDWDSDMEQYPELYEVIYEYPLPEKFRSYAGLTGTDGKPIGDLNHYPEEMMGVEDVAEAVPAKFALAQNYPNPFNPATTITYRLRQSDAVQLTVYNLLGEKVKTLVDAQKIPGNYSVTWNGTNDAGISVSSGVYFYKLELGSNSTMKKMLLMK